MAILQDDDKRFKGLEKKIGLFVIVALLGIALTVIAVGVQHDAFSPKTRLYFVSDSGTGIDEGLDVKLSGFVIGKVEKLELTDGARVRVTMAIKNNYMKWVKRDSRARLLKEGVIGANIIEVTPGSVVEPVLEEDAQIAFERERGLGQVVDELYAEVIPLIEDLKRVARRADALLAGLPATQEKLDAALTSAKKNFENLEKVTASDIPAITKRGRETVEKAGETMEKANKVVDSVSRTWPISTKIKAPAAETLPVDSYAPASAPKQ